MKSMGEAELLFFADGELCCLLQRPGPKGSLASFSPNLALAAFAPDAPLVIPKSSIPLDLFKGSESPLENKEKTEKEIRNHTFRLIPFFCLI